MRMSMRQQRRLAILLFFLLSLPGVCFAKWWRGQVHIHTNLTKPAAAVSWYRYHGYQFAILTDLNYSTPVDGLKAVYDAPGRFIVIPGIELSVEVPEPGDRIHDTMGYGGNPRNIWEFRDETTNSIRLPREPAADTYNRQARLIRAAGGIPAIAHPNLTWSCTVEDILKTDPSLIKHFEVSTSEPGMNDRGGGGHPSTEEMWDQVLSTGRVLYGVAADDSHHFDHFDPQTFFAEAKPFTIYPALPGRSSIYVQAETLTADAIIAAIDRGDFYSVRHDLTAPIEFQSYDAGEKGIRIKLSDKGTDIGWALPGKNPRRYHTYFIGEGGRVLKHDESLSPSYESRGDELYVRARVEGSDGAVAWTQPVFVRKPVGGVSPRPRKFVTIQPSSRAHESAGTALQDR
jgi:hypothetical protein